MNSRRVIGLYAMVFISLTCCGDESVGGSPMGKSGQSGGTGTAGEAAGTTGGTGGMIEGSSGMMGEGTGGSNTQKLPRPEICEKYETCAINAQPLTAATVIEAYGVDGSCWKSTSEVAAKCTEACQIGIEMLHPLNPKACPICTSNKDCAVDSGGCDTETGECRDWCKNNNDCYHNQHCLYSRTYQNFLCTENHVGNDCSECEVDESDFYTCHGLVCANYCLTMMDCLMVGSICVTSDGQEPTKENPGFCYKL
jgi:hypothetical protein